MNWLGIAALITSLVALWGMASKSLAERRAASLAKRREIDDSAMARIRDEADAAATQRFRILSDEHSKQLGVLIERITDITARVVVLEGENTKLRKRIDELETENARLRGELASIRKQAA